MALLTPFQPMAPAEVRRRRLACARASLTTVRATRLRRSRDWRRIGARELEFARQWRIAAAIIKRATIEMAHGLAHGA